LTEDLDNWSCYGPSEALALVERMPMPALTAAGPAMAAGV
jgi:hypothetical protein